MSGRTMTERDVQRWLYWRLRDTYAVLLPNYEPKGWHECDLFGVTRAGYFHEFEIKLTAADFRADAEKKSRDTFARPETPGGEWARVPGRSKHVRLATADTKGPSRFTYVMPMGLVDRSNVPDWAGIIYVGSGRFGGAYETKFGRVTIARPAPKLHPAKVPRATLRHAMNVCYYRFWNERVANYEAEEAAISQPEPTP